jgi:hypothetical protein
VGDRRSTGELAQPGADLGGHGDREVTRRLVVDLLAALQKSVAAAQTARGEADSDSDDGADDDKAAKKSTAKKSAAKKSAAKKSTRKAS